jgi:predicted molibdopterin-dependent oxidoreductase YjgC
VVPIEGSQPFDYIPVRLDGPSAPGADFTIHRARTMYDDGVRLRHCGSLHPLAPGAVAHINPADAPGLGATDGASVNLTTTHGEAVFTAILDETTPKGVVYVPANQPGGASLGTDPVVRVKVVT